jgi:hypothetical protein
MLRRGRFSVLLVSSPAASYLSSQSYRRGNSFNGVAPSANYYYNYYYYYYDDLGQVQVQFQDTERERERGKGIIVITTDKVSCHYTAIVIVPNVMYNAICLKPS